MKYDRRSFLKFLGVGGIAATNSAFLASLVSCQDDRLPGLSPSFADQLLLAPGLSHSILISYGDPINKQEVFGFNNDYINIHPLENDDLIMLVNHEYVHPLFINGYERSKENVEAERKLVGASLLRVKKTSGRWEFVKDDPYNKGVRGDTKIPFAQGVSILGKTQAVGTLANCAGGKTPWGTFLSCEENYDLFFGERRKDGSVSSSMLGWEKVFSSPPEHYGWVVEIDPKSGAAKKHVNLGRFSHESATCATAKDGRAVVYTGDDKAGEHLYKFVSDKKDSFDSGVLYVAKIEDNMQKSSWLPLDLEKSPLLKKSFNSQLEVMINARAAAKLLGATPLDRPEDVEINPLTGDVFVAMTNNKSKGNHHGHILKIEEDGKDHGAQSFKWSVFKTGGSSGFSCPDNMAFDRNGNLWIATDMAGGAMGREPYKKFGNNGLFVIPSRGEQAGETIQLASAPVDAEFTGICFSPDQKSLFLSAQHPGETSKSLDNLTSHWPTGKMPKPSVVAIEGKLLEKLTQ